MNIPAGTVSLRPSTPRLWLQPGAVITAAGAAVIAVLWLVLPPAGPTGDRVGAMLGVEAIWLMSWSVFAMSDRRVGRWLNGVGGQLWWHRLAGALGIIAAIAHPRVLVTLNDLPATSYIMDYLEKVSFVLVLWAFIAPNTRISTWRGPLGWIARRSYDWWRIVHAVLAAYVGFALYHGLDGGHQLHTSPILTLVYLAVAAFGAWVLIDQLVLRRFRNRAPGGTVTRVVRAGRELLLWVRADGRAAQPGEFVYLGVRSSKERPIPLTVASVDADGMQFLISAAGKGSTRLINTVAVGDRVSLSRPQLATVEDPLGASNVWVAGGSGITPMLGSLATMTRESAPVTLIWSRRGDAPAELADRLADLASTRPWLRVKIVDTLVAPRVTVDDVLAEAGAPLAELRVRLCGPVPMLNGLYRSLTDAGVPSSQIAVESFAFR